MFEIQWLLCFVSKFFRKNHYKFFWYHSTSPDTTEKYSVYSFSISCYLVYSKKILKLKLRYNYLALREKSLKFSGNALVACGFRSGRWNTNTRKISKLHIPVSLLQASKSTKHFVLWGVTESEEKGLGDCTKKQQCKVMEKTPHICPCQKPAPCAGCSCDIHCINTAWCSSAQRNWLGKPHIFPA